MKKLQVVFRQYLLLLHVLVFGMALNALQAETFNISITVNGILQSHLSSSTGSDSTVYGYGGYHVGREGGTALPYFIYRSYAIIDRIALNFPADAVIDGATISLTFSSYLSNYSLKITRMTSNPSGNSYQTNWSSIAGGTSLADQVTTASTQTPSITSLVSLVQGVVDNNTGIYLGFLSNSEGSSGTVNSFTLTIQGSYHRQTSPYYPKNSFNAGVLTVEGNPNVPSGTQFNWLDLEQHSLAAQDQPYGGYNYVWNTSGTAPSISKWQEQLPNQQPTDLQNGGTRSYSYTSLKSHAGASVIANMKRVCNVYLTKQTEFDGIISPVSLGSVVEQNPFSAQAPSTITVGSNTYPFACWSDGSLENPRSVTPSQHTYLTAIYKMHLQSNNSTVTAAWTQSRLATNFSAVSAYTQCMIYESAGEIWSSTRVMSGGVLGSWGNEKRASSGNGNNRNPSIVNQNSNEFFAVWERWANNEQEIWVARNYWGNWETPKKIINFPKSGSSYSTTRPVIVALNNGGNSQVTVYYTRSSTIYGKVSTDGGQTWYDTNQPISNSSFPCVEVTTDQTVVGVADYGYQMLYFYLNNTPFLNPGLWGYSDMVPFSYWFDFSGQGDLTESQPMSPQIRTSTWGRTYISWLQYLYSDDYHYYYVSVSKNGGWSSATAYEASNPYAELSGPSLALTGSVPQKSIMVWSENNQLKRVSGDISSGSWGGTITPLENGKYPFLEQGKPHLGNTASYEYTQQGSPLTSINSNQINAASLPKLGSALTEAATEEREYVRAVYAMDTVTRKTFTIRMTQPRIGKNRVQFIPVNDTLPGINAKNFFNYLKTDPLGITLDNDSLEFTMSIYSKGFEDSTFFLPLSLSAESEIGKGGNVLSLNHNLKERFTSFTVKKTIKGMRNKQLWLNPIGKLPEEKFGKNWMFGIAHIYQNPNKGTKLAKNVVEVPSQYNIFNYPNPFNPVTTINYQLPKDGIVTLRIYDMLGREITTLVNEYKTTGYYTARFDASNLASGMYIYRFTALPFDGGQKDLFTSVKKILLIK